MGTWLGAGDPSGGYYSNSDWSNHGSVDQGSGNQGALEMEEPTEFSHGLNIWLERKNTQGGFEILRT